MTKELKKELTERVLEEELFLSDGLIVYRTEPPRNKKSSLKVFCRTKDGEAEVEPNTKHFTDMILGFEIAQEITRESYDSFLFTEQF